MWYDVLSKDVYTSRGEKCIKLPTMILNKKYLIKKLSLCC